MAAFGESPMAEPFGDGNIRPEGTDVECWTMPMLVNTMVEDDRQRREAIASDQAAELKT